MENLKAVLAGTRAHDDLFRTEGPGHSPSHLMLPATTVVALITVAEAARDLANVIERRRPLDGLWTNDAFDIIYEAQDEVLRALGTLKDA